MSIARLTASSWIGFALIAAVTIAAPNTTTAKTPTPRAASTQQAGTPAGRPAAPSEAALLFGGAEVFWKDNSNNETGFRITIRVSGSPDRVATYEAAANAISFLLPPGAPHVCDTNGGPALFGSVVALGTAGESTPSHFGLFAVCGDASAPAATARVAGTPTPRRSGTPAAIPAAPSNVLLLGGAQVLWKDNSDNETGFQITISISGESVGRQATYDVPANITSILLPPNAPHVCERAGDFGINFAVVAFNAAGSSVMARSGIAAECGEPAIAPTAEVRLPGTGTSTSAGQPLVAGTWLLVIAACLIVGALSAARGLSRRR